jgi:hypothetical protein
MLQNLKHLPVKDATMLKSETTTAEYWLLGRNCMDNPAALIFQNITLLFEPIW